MASNSSESQYKVVLIGDHGVGKTSFIKRLTTGNFEEKYNETQYLAITPVTITTEKGPVTFNVWDCRDTSKSWIDIGEGYYIGADAAIIMCDMTKQKSYERIKYWLREFSRVAEKAPIVICGNKADRKDKIDMKTHCEMSVKNSINLEVPFHLIYAHLLQRV